ncbi:DUF5615 family PIN-like protein [Nocardioides sp. AE5]|uniref:DUF5615 family PIN-like protein n=1 Tax=Nocardioides sp. AE5 TaxID=2962573 RepID=UPI0028828881|nr:DUF5615 family PIN-like protein [Nocardioides sp. AE5]MDT0202497.1 DUF5615 family PIN-like protein [Nocardioides sp. AE5]
MTPRFLADENIDPDLVLGLGRAHADIDVVRVQDVDLRTEDDPTILEWAASEGRILLTHDISTVPDFAYARVTRGLPMPGVFIINTALPMALVIEEIALAAAVSNADEWRDRVVYLPF